MKIESKKLMSASCALVLVPVVGLLSMLRGQGYIYRNTGTLFLPELTANTGVMVVHSGQKGQEWRIAFPLNYKEIGLIFRNSIKFPGRAAPAVKSFKIIIIRLKSTL